ncbi:hypothetical protein Clacol_008330 [Clathrus columnatus]|uniref:Uncharacterized protein n=1 Tax=Clathrus columnatus TaxID=1419009 RepID=A0AAV5AKQ5_9AGAM|nr:hypothetical protein Clacol_008330 [Clathrus columnatus]
MNNETIPSLAIQVYLHDILVGYPVFIHLSLNEIGHLLPAAASLSICDDLDFVGNAVAFFPFIGVQGNDIDRTILQLGNPLLLQRLSSLLICEFTLDLRRRNEQKAAFNRSALSLPNLSFQVNPVQSMRSMFGRLQENIVAEMGESNDIVNIDGPNSESRDPQNELDSDGTDLGILLEARDEDQAISA